ncbi:hypothetical protein [Francisella-like endosymbiont]
MLEITKFSNIAIVADESVFDVKDAERIILSEFNIKLAKRWYP